MEKMNSVAPSAEKNRPTSAGAGPGKRKKKIILTVSIVCAVLLLLGAAGIAYHFYLENERAKEEERQFQLLVDRTVNTDTFYDGIFVQDIDLGGMTMDEAEKALAAVEPSLREEVEITAVYKDQQWQLTEDDFTYTFNTRQVLDEAYAVARSGDRMERYEQILALKESPKRFSIEASFVPDEAKLRDLMEEIRPHVEVQAKDVSVAKFEPLAQVKFIYSDGTPGLALDDEALYQSLLALMNAPKKVGTVEVPTKVTQYAVSLEEMKQRTQLLSSFTTVSTNDANGNKNMRLALAAANGKILQPGEVFSFNGTTGDTTNGKLGYVEAGAISNGKLIKEFGGGICQVSTTIYGAALRADMEIVSRLNHRWPSTYVPIGQDATVNYPTTDFKFKNSSDYPLYIAAYMTGVTLHVEFYGYHPTEWDTINVTSYQNGDNIAPPATQYVEDPTLAPGQQTVERKARAGKKAVGQKEYIKDGKVIKTEPISSSYYREVGAIIKVGPSAGEDTTPAS